MASKHGGIYIFKIRQIHNISKWMSLTSKRTCWRFFKFWHFDSVALAIELRMCIYIVYKLLYRSKIKIMKTHGANSIGRIAPSVECRIQEADGCGIPPFSLFLCPALVEHTVFVVSVRNGSQLTWVPWDLRLAGHTSAHTFLVHWLFGPYLPLFVFTACLLPLYPRPYYSLVLIATRPRCPCSLHYGPCHLSTPCIYCSSTPVIPFPFPTAPQRGLPSLHPTCRLRRCRDCPPILLVRSALHKLYKPNKDQHLFAWITKRFPAKAL